MKVDQSSDPADVVGELLFGRRLRLRVLLWVAEQAEPFHQTEAAAGVGYNSPGEVAKELERLVRLEMVRKFGRPGGVGRQYYRRDDTSPGWEVAAVARRLVDVQRAAAEQSSYSQSPTGAVPAL
ncbi:MAG TPA: hypothetical protein VLZ77_00970 [Acidimicrobiales bacterium]|nr:hypothetical protein [Acidimicrobiales bacterium]